MRPFFLGVTALFGVVLATSGVATPTILDTVTATVQASKQPNIIVWVWDDVGWADVGFHGSDFPTPNIDALVKSGLELSKMYAMPQCSPTRAALMTGRYSFRTGLSHFSTIFPGSSAGIPADTPTMAEIFRAGGYSTHAIGKWHLGYSKETQHPLKRGFDSYTGYLQGQCDYYNRTIPACFPGACIYKGEDVVTPYGSNGAGYDFWVDDKIAPEEFGTYTMDSYMARATQIIGGYGNGTSTKPLFLYFAEQLLHLPLQAPPDSKHLEVCRDVVGGGGTVNRTVLCSMASKLDESVGQFVSMVKSAGMWENTILWIVSDNGGMTEWSPSFPASASSNWPFRGGKTTLWEGGVKAVSFLTGGLLPANAVGKTSDALLHVVDILPTLAAFANVSLPKYAQDGLDNWDVITNQKPSIRTEVPLNIAVNPLNPAGDMPHIPHKTDGVANYSGLISWPWKIILGVPFVNVANQGGDRGGWWTVQNYTYIHSPDEGDTDVRLYNLETDAYEQHNVASTHTAIVTALTERVNKYASTENGFVNDQINVPRLLGNPSYHKWTWSNWIPGLEEEKTTA